MTDEVRKMYALAQLHPLLMLDHTYLALASHMNKKHLNTSKLQYTSFKPAMEGASATAQSQYGRAEQPADHSQHTESTLVVCTDSRACSGAEQPSDVSADVKANKASAENTGCQAAKQALDNPLLINIFEFEEWYTIARCAMVNNTWKQTADEWRRRQHEISVFTCRHITDEVLKLVTRSCPNLHTLDLRTTIRLPTVPGVSCTAAAVRAVARDFPGLRHLNFALGFPQSELPRDTFRCTTDDDVLPFVTYCQQLSSLVLSNCDITDKVLLTLTENCPKLELLDLKRTEITNHGIIMVAKKCLDLWSLCIAYTQCDERSLQVAFPELKHLDVSMCREMDSRVAFTAAMRNCPKLELMNGPMPGRGWTRAGGHWPWVRGCEHLDTR